MTNNPSSRLPAAWHTLAEFNIPGQLGANRLAQDYIATAMHSLNVSPADLERLKAVVAKAVLNAIEHGNQYQSDLPITVRLLISNRTAAMKFTGQEALLIPDIQTPNLTAKSAQLEPPLGWGFFLIERTVDSIQINSEESHHCIELFLYLE